MVQSAVSYTHLDVYKRQVFKLNAATARDSFAYNVGFGIEGTVFADIVLLAACVLLYLWGLSLIHI